MEKFLRHNKGQIVLIALFKTFIFIVLGIFLMKIYPYFKDLAFASTTSLWIRMPVLFMPAFYFIGVIFGFVNTIRGGANA